MTSQLPASAPTSAGPAFAHINAVTHPTIDDLKLMVFLEASGLKGYYALGASQPDPEIRQLLEANGREEMAHAHRVSKVIKLLTGEDFPPPADADNPFAQAPGRPVSRELLTGLVAAENSGNSLYGAWADTIGNAEAAALLRQNGKEEIVHGERAARALELMPA